MAYGLDFRVANWVGFRFGSLAAEESILLEGSIFLILKEPGCENLDTY